MKISEMIEQNVLVQKQKIGKVKDVVIDPMEWKVTHLEIELTKEAAEEILGTTPALMRPARNTLAISALEKGAVCCTDAGIDLKVSKGQLHIYLRPA